MVWLIVFAILIIVLTSLILYARWNYGSLEALGIPVIKPHFFLGTTHDAHFTVNSLRDIEWMKQYGSIYGVYEGRQPQIHINDIEMMRHVMVKDADYFNDRRRTDFGSPLVNEMPDFLPGEKWKVVRNLFSPQLSSGKIKLMSVPMNEAIKDYVVGLRKQISESPNSLLEKYDIKDGIFTMTSDLILRCVFSVKMNNSDAASSSNNHFIDILKRLLGNGESRASALNTWTLAFPCLKKLLTLFAPPGTVDGKAAEDFVVVFKDMMKTREENGIELKDFTSYIMELLDKVNTPEFKRVDVTELTIMCQALVFYFAAQDQICHIITLLTYFVGQHPKVEKKIVRELDSVLEAHNGIIDHECLSELTYLTACINEVLRLYPFFFRLERVCTKDWEMDGVKIKRGMAVMFPIWAANRNPKYFDEPDAFLPERFMPSNKDKLHPYAFTSFGHGPRNCIGQRFSYEALLLTAAHLLRTFKVIGRNETQLVFQPGNLNFTNFQTMYFDMSLTNKNTN